MAKQILETKEFLCPNSQCVFHLSHPPPENPKKRSFYKMHGTYPTSGGLRHRYQCRRCGKTFSETFFSLDYRMRRLRLDKPIFNLFKENLSNRQIGRLLRVGETTVRHRLLLLSRQALLMHAVKSESHKINEEISYDGVENFAGSQYEPNYINQAIGMNSGYIYDFNFSPLNRKGRMSDRQKLKNEKIVSLYGKFPTKAVRVATSALVERLCKRTSGTSLKLFSDEHFQYKESIRFDLLPKNYRVEHFTISAKAPRVYRHILFPVNHADLLLRQYVKAFARETISFSKTHAAMVLKYALFAAWKNYMRPRFIKPHRLDRLTNKQSPAMALGLERRILGFRAFFRRRIMVTQVQLNEDWKLFYDVKVPFPRAS